MDIDLGEGARHTAWGCGELGLALNKHLAGSAIDISEREFFEWARAGDVPDDQRRQALHEALVIMDAEETRRALFDDRASRRQVAELVLRCGADESRVWNNLLRLAAPDLEIKNLGEDEEWDKLLLWESGGRRVGF
ncbi:MAG: hypothetical protein OXF68_16445 [Gammaproteobacteria bacterium]|nr:hypothetical protein [Gammaproteobacteria bacterium]MCY4343425.1 hypothetical protein [Gammaproteobacteria bacterium]